MGMVGQRSPSAKIPPHPLIMILQGAQLPILNGLHVTSPFKMTISATPTATPKGRRVKFFTAIDSPQDPLQNGT